MGKLLPRSRLDDALALYRHEPLGIRAFVTARRLLAPLEAIARHVPPHGAVLDVGCGHGLFSLALAAADPQRRIVGIDPSPQKIEVARRVSTGLTQVQFQQRSIDAVIDERFAVIVVLDVLYLLPRDQKTELLRACRRLLTADGVLLLKTNDTHPTWKYRVAQAQERVMTSLRLTHGTGGLHFLSCDENAELLRRAGFAVEIIHLQHWSPYPHVLFVAR